MHVVNNSYGMYCAEALQRMYYYPPPHYQGGWGYYTPYMWFDGDKGSVSYSTWLDSINTRIDITSRVTITMWGDWSPAQGTGTIYAQFRNDNTSTLDGAVFFVVTEDSIYRVTPYDQWHNHVARDYLPTQTGESVSIPAGDSATFSRNFALDTAWNADMIQFVAWIQNPIMNPADSAKEIWQGAILNIDELGVEELGNITIATANVTAIPNPCVDGTRFSFTLPSGERYAISLYDVTGRKVQTIKGIAPGKAEHVTWDLRDDKGARVGSGVYLYRFESDQISTTGKVVVR